MGIKKPGESERSQRGRRDEEPEFRPDGLKVPMTHPEIQV